MSDAFSVDAATVEQFPRTLPGPNDVSAPAEFLDYADALRSAIKLTAPNTSTVKTTGEVGL